METGAASQLSLSVLKVEIIYIFRYSIINLKIIHSEVVTLFKA